MSDDYLPGVRPEFKVHSLAAMKMTRSRPTPPPELPVVTVRIPPAMWSKALMMANGNPRRIKTLGPGHVAIDPPTRRKANQ